MTLCAIVSISSSRFILIGAKGVALLSSRLCKERVMLWRIHDWKGVGGTMIVSLRWNSSWSWSIWSKRIWLFMYSFTSVSIASPGWLIPLLMKRAIVLSSFSMSSSASLSS